MLNQGTFWLALDLMVNQIDSPFTIIEFNLFVFGVTQINFIVIVLMDFVIISFARTKDFIKEWVKQCPQKE